MRFCILLGYFLVIGCGFPEVQDYGEVCLTSEPLEEGFELVVRANSRDCARDHKGAKFRCEVEVENEGEGTIAVRTYFRDGRDPNDACEGPLFTTCKIPVKGNSYSVHFGEHQGSLELPLLRPYCLPVENR